MVCFCKASILFLIYNLEHYFCIKINICYHLEFKIASEQVKDKTQDFKEFPCHYPPPLLSFRVCVRVLFLV